MNENVQSVIRAMNILDTFTVEKPEQSLREITDQTNLSKSTVFRLLRTLALCGYVKQDKRSQKYSLGLKLFHLGSVIASDTKYTETEAFEKVEQNNC